MQILMLLDGMFYKYNQILFIDAVVEFLYMLADFQSNCPINFREFSVEDLNYCRSMYFTFHFYQVFIHKFAILLSAAHKLRIAMYSLWIGALSLYNVLLCFQ